MLGRDFKDALFAQFAQIAAALGSPKRIEIVDLLAQGERSVEALAAEAGLTLANTSRHLQILKGANLVASRKDGLRVFYRLADSMVLQGYRTLQALSEARLAEVGRLVDDYFSSTDGLEPVEKDELLRRARSQEVVVIDVRPREEYAAGHIAEALSIPLAELEGRLAELPRGKRIVAYCRGRYCVLAAEAVRLLRKGGFDAVRLKDGYPEWRDAGLPVGTGNELPRRAKRHFTASRCEFLGASEDRSVILEASEEYAVNRIYFDHNASTPIATEVADAMRPFLDSRFGNPSSGHWAGVPAREAVERAREQVASLLGCSPGEIVFTSGGSESNNHAIKGAFFALKSRGDHIITTSIEHPSVLEPCRFLEILGARVTYAPVDRSGRVDPDYIRQAIDDRTILITVMHANNEVGTIQPIEEIGCIAQERGILFHTDAAQSVGKIPVNVRELGVDLLSLAGHKLYAPKGVGALYIRNGVHLEPLIHGAGHEQGRRAGTENVLLDVGLGAACEIAQSWVGMPEVRRLRDRLWEMLRDSLGDRVVLNGHPSDRLPNTLNVSLVGESGSDILAQLEGVAASTGSACHAGETTPSPVLQAMGITPEVSLGAIRFSLGRQSTMEEVAEVARCLREVVPAF
jgi:cysteine desulfurase